MANPYSFVRPMPDDFAVFAPGRTITEIRAHYKTSDKAAHRWFREAGVDPLPRGVPRPDDLTERAGEMHFNALARHYGVSGKTLSRWLAKTGAEPIEYQRTGVSRPRDVRYRTNWNYKGPKMRLPERDFSPEAQAADHLRRYTHVYRCTERGSADPRGSFYRYGDVVLTTDELIQRAERKGWRMAA